LQLSISAVHLTRLSTVSTRLNLLIGLAVCALGSFLPFNSTVRHLIDRVTHKHFSMTAAAMGEVIPSIETPSQEEVISSSSSGIPPRRPKKEPLSEPPSNKHDDSKRATAPRDRSSYSVGIDGSDIAMLGVQRPSSSRGGNSRLAFADAHFDPVSHQRLIYNLPQYPPLPLLSTRRQETSSRHPTQSCNAAVGTPVEMSWARHQQPLTNNSSLTEDRPETLRLRREYSSGPDPSVAPAVAANRESFIAKLAEENHLLKSQLEASVSETSRLTLELDQRLLETRKAQSDLADARDHIFGLQSGLKELTPREVSTVVMPPLVPFFFMAPS
jgi:hypothetical protein